MLMSALTGLIGWLLGLVELYVLSAALGTLAIGALVAVRLRRGRVRIERRLRPTIMTQGEPGHGRLVITNPIEPNSRRLVRRTPPVVLTERIGAIAAASIEIGALPPGEEVTARYQIPTDRRGVVPVGPVRIERTDPFRLARISRTAIEANEAVVAPATYSLGVPRTGTGLLGRHLAAAARRLGVGDFHSLRDYVEGDEPRSIHWRASARTDDLKVRQFELPGLTHCTVLLDTDTDQYLAARGGDSALAAADFERAVQIAASVVVAAATELATRLVALPSIDVSGPTAAHDALIELARIELTSGHRDEAFGIGNDRSDGLGLVVVVTPGADSTLWAATRSRRDPAVTAVAVCLAQAVSQWNMVDATTIDRFIAGWRRLSGVDAPQRPAIDWDLESTGPVATMNGSSAPPAAAVAWGG